MSIQKLAEILVHYSTEVQPGDLVMIRCESLLGQPLLQAVFQEVYKAGAHPVPFMPITNMGALAMDATDDLELLAITDPMYEMMTKEADVMISIAASNNPRALSGYPVEKQSAWSKGWSQASMNVMQRGATGECRWNVTQYPTQAYAQSAGMSLPQYEKFLLEACKTHLDDPVAAWQALSKEQDRLVDYLKGKKSVQVKGSNIDLTLSIDGRTFMNAGGKRNMPDGEIFTGPVEDSVNGWVKFTYPAYYRGNEVKGIELRFENGKVVDAKSETNQEFLQSILDTDAGSRYLGEFAIGTNRDIQEFTGSILFDEKIGGTVHMAVGKSYTETGGKNDSLIHWDMICDMRDGGEIYVEGDLFYKDGEFQV
jgi:aminopeptidase